MNQVNQLGALLLMAQPNQSAVGGGNLRIPIPGLNMMPGIGLPAVQEGSRLQPRLPIPLPFAPSPTRGEIATSVRPDIGSILGAVDG